MTSTTWANIIAKQIQNLPVSHPVVCALAGINLNKLGNFIAGTKDLDTATVLRVHEILKQLEYVKVLMSPIPVDFRDVRALRDLLERARVDGWQAIMPAYKPAAGEGAEELR
jgi:hypothetical protein